MRKFAILFVAICGLSSLAEAQVPLSPPRAFVTSQPSDPTGTASATIVEMGLGIAGAGGGFLITPTASGFVEFDVAGQIGNGTTTDGFAYEIDFGPVPNVAAPANGAAKPSGTVVCSKQVAIVSVVTNALTMPFSATCMVQLTPGVQWWFDIGLLASTGGTASVKQLTGFLKELN